MKINPKIRRKAAKRIIKRWVKEHKRREESPYGAGAHLSESYEEVLHWDWVIEQLDYEIKTGKKPFV